MRMPLQPNGRTPSEGLTNRQDIALQIYIAMLVSGKSTISTRESVAFRFADEFIAEANK